MTATPPLPRGFRLSVPPAVHLLGEHLDLAGLPAILLAGGPRLAIETELRDDRRFCLVYGGGGRELALSVDGDEAPGGTDGALLRTAIRLLQKRGAAFPQGYDISIDEAVPHSLPGARRAALSIGFVVCLLTASGNLANLSGGDIAAAAWDVQLATPGIEPVPGATFASALGGLVHVTPGHPPQARALAKEGAVFVLADVPGPRPPRPPLAGRFADAVTAVRRYFPHFDPAKSTLDDLVPSLADVADDQAQFLYALIDNRTICENGADYLATAGISDADVLAELIDCHHEMLRDHLGQVTEEEERFVTLALEAGALGAKANSMEQSGILAFAPDRADEVRQALEDAGATACDFSPAEGMSLEVTGMEGDA